MASADYAQSMWFGACGTEILSDAHDERHVHDKDAGNLVPALFS